MSVTTTANSGIISLRQTLAEYELHHSETNANPEVGSPAPAPNANTRPATQNPPDWDVTHRRVPPYRPVRRENLIDGGRTLASNNVERTFIFVMLNGVGMQSQVSRMWRATGEKITGPSWFRCKIGGEW